MELSWPMRLRIAAAMGIGVILLGIFGWPIVAPPEPLAAVSLVTKSIGFFEALALMFLAFLAGLIAYFASWPYGREIGILAAPTGLAVWALRTGGMANLMQANPNLTQRQEILATLKWEPFLWLAIVAAGYVGVSLGQKILSKSGLWQGLCPDETQPDETTETPRQNSKKYINAIIGLVGSVLIALLFIGIFAQDVKNFDNRLGVVSSQPATRQIAFAVTISFAIAAFLIKKFFDDNYIWTTIASALITPFAIITYAKQSILQHLTQYWPAVFFSNAGISILPVQMVAFGTLGSIAGYWLAIRYDIWRKTEE